MNELAAPLSTVGSRSRMASHSHRRQAALDNSGSVTAADKKTGRGIGPTLWTSDTPS